MQKVYALVFVLVAAPLFAQSHADVVAAVKTTLVSQGMDLSGPCGAYQITKRVAWTLRAEGAGLLEKPSGNHCESRAVDIVMYPDGRIFDVLVDGGGANQPAWNPGESVEASRYRPASDPGGSTPAPLPVPIPVPAPAPTPTDLSAVYQRFDLAAGHLERVYLDLVARDAQRQAQIAAVDDRLRKHDEDVGVLMQVFGNRYVQLGLTALGTFITQQQLTK